MFFSATPTTELYTLSLHDALPISWRGAPAARGRAARAPGSRRSAAPGTAARSRTAPTDFARLRSEEHTSELQSQFHLVCRLLLEKKKTKRPRHARHSAATRREQWL